MAFVSQKERIQRRLIAEAATGPFHGVTTDPDTRQITVDTVATVEPASAIAQEESTSFGPPRRHRRTERLERRNWRWALACTFNQEVTTEAFEKRLIASAIILPRDAVNDLEQVTLKLLGAAPQHPPQQSPRQGTAVTFTFEAELSPV